MLYISVKLRFYVRTREFIAIEKTKCPLPVESLQFVKRIQWNCCFGNASKTNGALTEEKKTVFLRTWD